MALRDPRRVLQARGGMRAFRRMDADLVLSSLEYVFAPRQVELGKQAHPRSPVGSAESRPPIPLGANKFSLI